LSNLTITPFVFCGISVLCVEALLQGIKFRDPDERQRVFAMDGLSALKAGRGLENPEFVYWQGEEIPYNSTEHRLLLASFLLEKVRQNPEVQRALLSTKDVFIYHDTGTPENPRTSLPEKFFMEALIGVRHLLERLASL
jgi:hypothetical protein